MKKKKTKEIKIKDIKIVGSDFFNLIFAIAVSPFCLSLLSMLQSLNFWTTNYIENYNKFNFFYCGLAYRYFPENISTDFWKYNFCFDDYWS